MSTAGATGTDEAARGVATALGSALEDETLGLDFFAMQPAGVSAATTRKKATERAPHLKLTCLRCGVFIRFNSPGGRSFQAAGYCASLVDAGLGRYVRTGVVRVPIARQYRIFAR